MKAVSLLDQMTDYVATRWYRSPELILTPRYGLPVDVWAAGCIMGEMIDGQPMFPGDDMLDQLFQIINVVGPFDEHLTRKFYENPILKNLRFPDPSSVQTLESRYRKKIDKAGLDLLSRLLDLDENTRLTAEQALLHPFFTDLLKEEPELMEEIQRVPFASMNSLSSLVNHGGKTNTRVERDDSRCDKENIQRNQNTVTIIPGKKNGEGKNVDLDRINNLALNDKNYLYKNINKAEVQRKNKDPKINDSFNEDNNRSKESRFQTKNKSENIDYKMKNRSKKFCTANSINFVIKKMNNFGVSLYNPKEKIRGHKPLGEHREKNSGLVKSTFFRMYDIPQTTPASNRLFPSIQNIKFGETKQNWNYKA